MIHTLVLCDDYWHPARTPRAGLAGLERHGFAFDWIEHAGEWSAERMCEYPLVVLTKANNVSASDQRPWMTDAVQAGFAEYVAQGGGLLVIHSGSAGYAELPMLRGLLGGVFLHHPPQCQVTVEPRAGHPLAIGSAPFTLVDEHYFMAFDDASADVCLSTVSEHGAQPGGWTRTVGAGRVCLLTPGHNLEVWLHPSYQQIIRNALGWCASRGA